MDVSKFRRLREGSKMDLGRETHPKQKTIEDLQKTIKRKRVALMNIFVVLQTIKKSEKGKKQMCGNTWQHAELQATRCPFSCTPPRHRHQTEDVQRDAASVVA